PVPPVSANEMHAVLVQAFMWLTIRARRSAGVVSMKLTVSRRGLGPQYFDVRMAIRRGSLTWKPSAIAAWAPNMGALTGLIRVAVSAAFTSRRRGSVFGVHTISLTCGGWSEPSLPTGSSSGPAVSLMTSLARSAMFWRASRSRRSFSLMVVLPERKRERDRVGAVRGASPWRTPFASRTSISPRNRNVYLFRLDTESIPQCERILVRFPLIVKKFMVFFQQPEGPFQRPRRGRGRQPRWAGCRGQ